MLHCLPLSFAVKRPEEMERKNNKEIGSLVVLPGLAGADEAELDLVLKRHPGTPLRLQLSQTKPSGQVKVWVLDVTNASPKPVTLDRLRAAQPQLRRDQLTGPPSLQGPQHPARLR